MMVLPSREYIEAMDMIRPWLREDMSVDYIKHDLAEDAPDDIKEIYDRLKKEGVIGS